MTPRDEKLRTSWNTILACSKRHISLRNIILGFLVCSSLSLMLARLFRNAHGHEVIPLVFLVVVGLVAHFLGTTSAIVGLVSAGVAFANFLFAPLGHLSIEDESARTNLMLMLLFGLAIAYFYGVEDPPESTDSTAHDQFLGPPASH
jgi:K+-sensing histidine kinase KdpD